MAGKPGSLASHHSDLVVSTHWDFPSLTPLPVAFPLDGNRTFFIVFPQAAEKRHKQTKSLTEASFATACQVRLTPVGRCPKLSVLPILVWPFFLIFLSFHRRQLAACTPPQPPVKPSIRNLTPHSLVEKDHLECKEEKYIYCIASKEALESVFSSGL